MNRSHLKNVYDCINNIARKREARGADCSNWFYTDTEFERVKRDNKNSIL